MLKTKFGTKMLFNIIFQIIEKFDEHLSDFFAEAIIFSYKAR